MGKEIIEGISYGCGIDKVQNKDFSLSPARYIQVEKRRETLSNNEIDKRLHELYTEIKELII